ncbi:9870_t:CDS:2, partial [Dentiscutata heterogama]
MSFKTSSDSDFDVKIIVGNGRNTKEFKAHSTILSSRSLYFQRALSERWNNKEQDFYVFKNPNIYPDTFEIILEYFRYFGFNEKAYSSETPNSFIFSFTNPSNPILSRMVTGRNNKAIWSDKYHGPCFGNFELQMNSNCWSYAHSNHYHHRITNSSQFTVDEYEVLAVNNFNQSINVVLKKIPEL